MTAQINALSCKNMNQCSRKGEDSTGKFLQCKKETLGWIFCWENGYGRQYLNSSYAEGKTTFEGVHGQWQRLLMGGQGWGWGTYFVLSLPKDIVKQHHLSEAGINSVDREPEEALFKTELHNMIFYSAFSKLWSKKGTEHKQPRNKLALGNNG